MDRFVRGSTNLNGKSLTLVLIGLTFIVASVYVSLLVIAEFVTFVPNELLAILLFLIGDILIGSQRKFWAMRFLFMYTGIWLAYFLNLLLVSIPNYFTHPELSFILVIFIGLGSWTIYTIKEFNIYMKARLILLGASMTSVILAFVKFASFAYTTGNITISPATFIGIFGSILSASLFSFFERFVKFFEDRKERQNLDRNLKSAQQQKTN